MLQVFNGMILPIVFVELHPFSLAEDYLLKNVNELLKEKSIEKFLDAGIQDVSTSILILVLKKNLQFLLP